MKKINTYIQEKLVITKDTKLASKYTCHPEDWYELKSILKERLVKDKNADLNDIDVSKITDMSALFMDLDPHNIKIDKWDVSNVIDMQDMFEFCENFNCDLSKWDVKNVENMSWMFYRCENFTGEGLDNWKISSNVNMKWAFEICSSLKNIPSWYKAK